MRDSALFFIVEEVSLYGCYTYLIAYKNNYCTNALLGTEIHINNKAYHTECHYKIF